LKRSAVLVNRLRTIGILIQIRNLCVAVISLLLFQVMLNLGSPLSTFASLAPFLFIVLVHPLIAIAIAIIYYRGRQAGGELLEETAEQGFEQLYTLRTPVVSYKRAAVVLITIFAALPCLNSLQKELQDDLLLKVLDMYTLGSRKDVVKALLAAGADPNIKTKE